MPVAVVPNQEPTMAHGRPCLPCSSLRVLPLLALTRLRNGLGLRRGRRERECAGQQQCPEDSCGRHDLHHIGRSLGPAHREMAKRYNAATTAVPEVVSAVNRFPTTSVRCSVRGPTATSARSLADPIVPRAPPSGALLPEARAAGHSLQTTALVNEAYMRLVDYKRMQWQNRAHFMAAAAQAMRRILVDHARRHNAKRGANASMSLDARLLSARSLR